VSCLPHALHLTIVLAHPKIICVELHSVHDIFKNLDFGFGKTSLSFIFLHQFEFLESLGLGETFRPAFPAREHRHGPLVDLAIPVEDGLGLGTITPELPVISAPAFC